MLDSKDKLDAIDKLADAFDSDDDDVKNKVFRPKCCFLFDANLASILVLMYDGIAAACIYAVHGRNSPKNIVMMLGIHQNEEKTGLIENHNFSPFQMNNWRSEDYVAAFGFIIALAGVGVSLCIIFGQTANLLNGLGYLNFGLSAFTIIWMLTTGILTKFPDIFNGTTAGSKPSIVDPKKANLGKCILAYICVSILVFLYIGWTYIKFAKRFVIMKVKADMKELTRLEKDVENKKKKKEAGDRVAKKKEKKKKEAEAKTKKPRPGKKDDDDEEDGDDDDEEEVDDDDGEEEGTDDDGEEEVDDSDGEEES